jgi:deoxyhypusine monooxygenase
MKNNYLEDFQSKSSEQRIQFIFNFLFDSSESAITKIGNVLLLDPSPIVRHEAAYILGEKNNESAIPYLTQAIENDNNKIVIHESALALANLGNICLPAGKDILSSLLKSFDENIKDTAEIALQRLELKTSKNVFSPSIEECKTIILDFSPQKREKRIQSAFKLMEDASSESVEFLIQALQKEPSPIVKHELIFCLGECIYYKVIPAFLRLLEEEKNFFVVHETLLALGTLGEPSTENSMRKFLTHSDPDIVESAEIGLERLLS